MEQKKVDKRGLLGLGYDYGLGYGHGYGYGPAVSYAKVTLGPGLGYGPGYYGSGYGLGYNYAPVYKSVAYSPAYSYYGPTVYGHELIISSKKMSEIEYDVCILLFVLAVVAKETTEQKKVDKRGLLGLGYDYGLGYGHDNGYGPAVSYAKVTLGPGLGYGPGYYGSGYGLGYNYAPVYKSVAYSPAYSYYGPTVYGHELIISSKKMSEIEYDVCILLFVLAVVAKETTEQKKVDKRGLLGLGYDYGLGYGPGYGYGPAVSYAKVTLGPGLGYGPGYYGSGYGLGYNYAPVYKSVAYSPAYSYYGPNVYGHGYYGHGYNHYGYY
ncbi:hypothetical protein C0J52_19894 [Blattella germanica]|nr:hypothetical protein C0J52_19894 [Blattella germanica]